MAARCANASAIRRNTPPLRNALAPAADGRSLAAAPVSWSPELPHASMRNHRRLKPTAGRCLGGSFHSTPQPGEIRGPVATSGPSWGRDTLLFAEKSCSNLGIQPRTAPRVNRPADFFNRLRRSRRSTLANQARASRAPGMGRPTSGSNLCRFAISRDLDPSGPALQSSSAPPGLVPVRRHRRGWCARLRDRH